MSRYIELGNYRDESFFCKLDDVFNLFLGVKTAVGFLVAAGFTAHRTVLGKARIFVNLNAPALIVGQMPMEHVEFKERNCLDILFHDFDREKCRTVSNIYPRYEKRGSSLISQQGISAVFVFSSNDERINCFSVCAP